MTNFVTCDLCDEHKNDTDGAFRVLPPVFRDFGKRLKFAGPVSTVKCFEDNSLGVCWWWMGVPRCAVPWWAAIWARRRPRTVGPA